MKNENPVLHIKITEHGLNRQDLENLSQWENEGGAVREGEKLLSNITAPVRPGQIFEVLRGELIFEEGEVFYVAEVSLLSLE